MTKNSLIKLAVSIVLVELVGIIGAVFTTPAINGWYNSLVKPPFTPPNYIFAPVWTILFAFMGIAFFLIWQKGFKNNQTKKAAVAFVVQLILNLGWSFIFFRQQAVGVALIEIIILWIAILITIFLFYKISKLAAWLMIPYLLWVTFAGFLNYSIWQLNRSLPNNTTVCTQEAKLCPDGSYVGRSGVNCQFAACPNISQIIPSNWKSFSDTKSGLFFRYPAQLGTTYIHALDWPPAFQILNQNFNCNEAGLETARAGQTQKYTINGQVYCVTKNSEGAAGSIYTQYAYAFPKGNRTVVLNFSLRSVQCANYDDPQKTACQKEQASFDINNLIHQIATSLTLSQ